MKRYRTKEKCDKEAGFSPRNPARTSYSTENWRTGLCEGSWAIGSCECEGKDSGRCSERRLNTSAQLSSTQVGVNQDSRTAHRHSEITEGGILTEIQDWPIPPPPWTDPDWEPPYIPGPPNWIDEPDVDPGAHLSHGEWREVAPGVFKYFVWYSKSGWIEWPPMSFEAPKLCCCPTSIEIEGGDGRGGYEYSPTESERRRWPDCVGHTFDVTVEYEWKPSAKFSPCELEWIESSNVVQNPGDYRRFVDWYLRSSRAVASGGSSGVTSATLVPWAVEMDPLVLGVNPRTGALLDNEFDRRRIRQLASRDFVRSLAAGPRSVTLVDSPCYPLDPQPGQHDHRTGEVKREILGIIRVKAGCPAGECEQSSVSAGWAQLVEVAPDGKLQRSWFTQTPRSRSPRPPGTAGGDSVATGYVRWRRRVRSTLERSMNP